MTIGSEYFSRLRRRLLQPAFLHPFGERMMLSISRASWTATTRELAYFRRRHFIRIGNFNIINHRDPTLPVISRTLIHCAPPSETPSRTNFSAAESARKSPPLGAFGDSDTGCVSSLQDRPARTMGEITISTPMSNRGPSSR